MLFPRIWSGVLGASVIAASVAQAQSYTSTFDFRVSGIRAGEITISGEQNGQEYTVEAKGKTAGIVDAFADYYFDGTSNGQISSSGTLTPSAYEAKSKSPRAERITRINWDQGVPVSVLVDPPRSSAPEPATQAGTLDPLSTGFALLRDVPTDQVCNKTVDVFDGSRRSRITLSTAVSSEDMLTCSGVFERLEGEADTYSASRSYNFTLEFRDVNGIAQLNRFETKTKFGNAVLKRK